MNLMASPFTPLETDPDMAKDETLIFLHLPKTGGLTLDGIIDRLYPEEQVFTTDNQLHRESIAKFMASPESDRASYKVVRGHMSFGVHQAIPGPSSYFTILRDPFERTISGYHYIHETVNHPSHKSLVESGYSLRQVIERRALPAVSPNQQVRWLTGYDMGKDITPELLELAKRNLVERFSVAGLTEAFDESLILIAHRYGWRNVWYDVRNATKRRPKADRIDPETLEALRDYNKYDIELYEFAKRRFEEQAQAYGPRLRREVKALRARNWMHRKMTTVRWSVQWKFRHARSVYRRLTPG